MARKLPQLQRALDAPALASVAYGEVASSLYFALGIVTHHAGPFFLSGRLLHGLGSACVFVSAQALALQGDEGNDRLVGGRARQHGEDRDQQQVPHAVALALGTALFVIAGPYPLGARRLFPAPLALGLGCRTIALELRERRLRRDAPPERERLTHL